MTRIKIKAEDPPLNMLAGMAMAAFMCILIGVYPKYLYDMLPYPIQHVPYTAEHLVWTSEILLFTWLGYYLYIKTRHQAGGKPRYGLVFTERAREFSCGWIQTSGAG